MLKDLFSKPKESGFNLLRPARPQLSVWDKIYFWVSGTCRILIIFIEILLIISLAWRFWADRELNNLRDSIDKGLSILRYYYPEELKFRDMNDAIRLEQGIEDNDYAKFDKISSLLPLMNESLKYDLNFSENRVTVNVFGDKDKLGIIESSIKSSKSYENVVVSNYELVDKNTNIYKLTIIGNLIESNE